MNTQKKWICVLALAAALSAGGCGNEGPVQITIGDPAVAGELSKHVTITSELGQGFFVYGNSMMPKERQFITGKIQDDYRFPSKERLPGLDGMYMTTQATKDGFTFTREEDGTVLYEENGYQGATNFRMYCLSTSDPGLRLWVVAGPDRYPSLVWVLKETTDGITTALTPDDFQKAGLSLENAGKERLKLAVENGALTVEKFHMDKVEPSQSEKVDGKTKMTPAKVDWKSDKKVAVVWDDKAGTFTIGSVPSASSGGFLASLFHHEDKIGDLQVLSMDMPMKMDKQEDPASRIYSCTLTTSNGKEMKLVQYPAFFKITSADGSAVYYTSQLGLLNTRFRVMEVKVSDPDTRLWSIKEENTGNAPADFGYWLIGEHKGVLKVYLSPDDFTKSGVPFVSRNFPEGYRAHQLRLSVDNGVIQVKMPYEFSPAGKSHAEAWILLDHTFTIAWDKDAQKFVIKDVAQPDVPTGGRRGQMLRSDDWEPLAEDQQKTLKQDMGMSRYHVNR